MLLCSLTNTPTQNPVLSLKSKHVFDAKVLELYVSNNGSDPITNEQMTKEDIIPIKHAPSDIPSSAELTNPTYSSIPTMLTAFQNAWDSLSLELFHLRSELDKTRKELSLALYRQDAAVKVAVGACKERDEARHALTQLIANGDTNTVDIPLETVPKDDTFDSFTKSLKSEQEQLLALHKKENKERKGRSPLYSLDLQTLRINVDKKSIINRKNASVLKTDTNSKTKQTIVFYASGIVEVIDFSAIKLKQIAKVKATNLLAFWLQDIPHMLISEGGKHYLFNIISSKKIILETDMTEVREVVGHPTLNLLILVGTKEIDVIFNHQSLYEQQLEDEVKSVRFHPDGLLIGISYKGNKGIDIYDLVERMTKLNIECQNPRDIFFAANGYQMFIRTDSKILLFDMRKAIITLEAPFDDDNDGQILVDDYTSIVVCGNSYLVLDKKGKSIEYRSNFELENNGHIVGYFSSNEGEGYFVAMDTGIVKATLTN